MRAALLLVGVAAAWLGCGDHHEAELRAKGGPSAGGSSAPAGPTGGGARTQVVSGGEGGVASPPDESSTSAGRAEEGTGREDPLPVSEVFGTDALLGAFERDPVLPHSLSELEVWLGIGRACADTISKRVYLIEEAQTRPNGQPVRTASVVPRLVLAGCSGSPLARTEVMAAIVSHADSARENPLRAERVELMAFDERSGLFNFYAMALGAQPEVARFLTSTDGGFERRSWSQAAGYSQTRGDVGECFACHVNGGPIMNELTSPWLGWVSEVRPHSLRNYTGLTAQLVAEADGSGADGRTSQAYDLERGLKSGIDHFVSGLESADGGFSRAVLAGVLPGCGRRLLRSVFCETELNYESRPLSLYFDPQSAAGSGLTGIGIPPDTPMPRLIPTRSHFDRSVEEWLAGAGYLRRETALAIRLFDHEHDVFSDARCSLLDALPLKLPDPPSQLDRMVCEVLQQRWLSRPATPQQQYAEALCYPGHAAEDLEARRQAHLASLVTQMANLAEDLARVDGRAALAEVARLRVERARQLFPAKANPLPLFE